MSPTTARTDGIVVAIDGGAASGKSSTARAVARELGYRHLDSGAFYRALTWSLLRSGLAPERWSELSDQELVAMRVGARPREGGFAVVVADEEVGEALRAPDVTRHVSRVAAIPAVRGWLLGLLRGAAEGGGLVADGRDIGTVVFPDAELKIFLVCAPEERALRRLREQGRSDPQRAEIAAEVALLLERDRLDSERETAPLLRAPDAVQLDTTALDFGAQVRAIVRLAKSRAGD